MLWILQYSAAVYDQYFLKGTRNLNEKRKPLIVDWKYHNISTSYLLKSPQKVKTKQ